MQHTQGPWTESTFCDGLIKASDDIAVAFVADKFRSKPEFIANTKLIVASPDLAEALAGLLNALSDIDTTQNTAGHIKTLGLAESFAQEVLKKAGV